jgi:cell division septation protein DedD
MNLTNEERNRSRSSRANGWLATLAGAGLLVAVGFGVGLVAGTAYEEPELVAQHVAGQTTDVALGPDAAPPAGDDGDIAAAPPAADFGAPEAAFEAPPAPLGTGALDDARAPAKPAAGAAPAQPPAANPPPGGAGFSIQVGAFASEATARQLAGELGKRGYAAYVTEEGAGARYKVRVGPLGSRSEAAEISERLKTEHRLPTWILAGATR